MTHILHLENNKFFIEEVNWVMGDNFKDIADYQPVLNEEKAKEELKKKKADLLVVDLMLDTDYDCTRGINFIEEIKREYPQQKIMVLSARGDRKYREQLKDKVVLYETKDDIEEACNKMVNLVK